jgi:ankyrin repeat protein
MGEESPWLQTRLSVPLFPAIAGRARQFFHHPLLHTALFYESLDVIEPLVNAGLDVNAKSKFGDTLLDSIKAKGYYAMEEKLRQLGAKE